MEPLSSQEVADCNREQIKAMEEHRRNLSAAANRDVGKAAYIDWINNHALAWRKEWIKGRKNARSETNTPPADQ